MLCDLLAGEQDVNVCAAAVDVLAEVGDTAACPVLAPLRRALSATTPFWASRSRSPPIASTPQPYLLVIEYPALTEDEFRRLCEFLYRRTGMVFTESKRYYVERRVLERMSATGSGSFASYFARLRTDAEGEIEQFVNAFTVNETYFYREDHQLKCLTTDLLTERVRDKNARRRRSASGPFPAPPARNPIRWRSGCWKTGPWSMNTKLRSSAPISIPRSCSLRAHGVFGQRALMRLAPDLIEKYFTAAGRGELADPR